MFFRSFCAKLHLWSQSRALKCFSKAFPLSTSASVQAKIANNSQTQKLIPKRNEFERGCCGKNGKQVLKEESNQSEKYANESLNQGSKERNNKVIFSTNQNHKRQKRVTSSVLTNNKESLDSDEKNFTDLLQQAVHRLINSNSNDWEQVRCFILENEQNRGKYTAHNLDSNIIGYCMSIERFDLASSYFKYLLHQKLKPNLATLAKYLKVLYFRNSENCSKDDEQEILTLYKEISNEYPVLESNSLSALILALSLTTEWKKTLEIMEELKKFSPPSQAAYSAVVSAMFSNKKESLAWTLLEEMRENDKYPNSIALLSYLKSIKRLRKLETKAEKLEKLFNFLKHSEMLCPEDVSHSILEITQKQFFGSAEVRISLKGNCQNCGEILEKSELSEAEFGELKQMFMENVILGKDLFLKSDPSELSKFKEFIENMDTFDVVLDGLNIAYSTGDKNSQVQAKLLTSVVRHFRENNKSVLVLGRVHMRNWPKASWKYIVENSSVFLTKNISQDDPYLLYCALHSGRDTIIVTRDLMRSHRFLLKDVKFRRLFQKWLDQRQHILLTIGKNDQPIFKKPPDFSPIAQKYKEIWHIPYESSVEAINEQFHKTWLCINLKL